MNDETVKAQSAIIRSWRDWHAELARALGAEFCERNVTLERARELARLAELARKGAEDSERLDWLAWVAEKHGLEIDGDDGRWALGQPRPVVGPTLRAAIDAARKHADAEG